MKPYLLLTGLVCAVTLHAQTDTIHHKRKLPLRTAFITEYIIPLTPLRRDIKTVNADFLIGAELFRNMPLSVMGGIATTYAWGMSSRVDKNYNRIKYQNKVFGAGPVLMLKWEPVIFKGFTLAPEVSGGLLFYTSHFPHGGDIYNFMARLGGSANYHLHHKYIFSVFCRWMHVSNGQGLNLQNPKYEGWGWGIGFAKKILVRHFLRCENKAIHIRFITSGVKRGREELTIFASHETTNCFPAPYQRKPFGTNNQF